MKNHENTVLDLKKYFTDIMEENFKEISELKVSIQ